MPDNIFVASDEYALHCDVCGCDAQLSLVFGVSRHEHGWGRVTVHNDTPTELHMLLPKIDVAKRDQGVPFSPGTTDYDLCAEHYKQLNAVLKRT